MPLLSLRRMLCAGDARNVVSCFVMSISFVLMICMLKTATVEVHYDVFLGMYQNLCLVAMNKLLIIYL